MSNVSRISWKALVAAIAVLLLAGASHRVLSQRLERAPEQLPFAPGTLNALPLAFGAWVGRDEPVSEAIIEAADVDDYVFRRYVRQTDRQAVGLWIAFGIRARDLVPHRPAVCYPAAGWTMLDQKSITVQLANAQDMPARLYTFSPAGLGRQNLDVLNYYIVDDQLAEDIALLRAKAWRGQTAIRYMVQVQITSFRRPIATSDEPDDLLRDFAAQSYPLIRSILDDALQQSQTPAGSTPATEGP